MFHLHWSDYLPFGSSELVCPFGPVGLQPVASIEVACPFLWVGLFEIVFSLKLVYLFGLV